MSATGVVDRATEPPKVDPRMRDRWVRARRQEGQRRLRWLVVVGVVVALAAAAFGVSRSPLLAAEHIRVAGAQHETAGQVSVTAGLATHPALLGLDTTAAARRIEALPWVARAHVARQWPSTVTVVLTERSAVAVVAQDIVGPNAVPAVVAGAPTVLVDDTGRVLTSGNGLVPGLPVILSPGLPGAPGQWLAGTTPGATEAGTATPLDALLELAADLPATLSPSVVYLNVGNDGSLQGAVSVPLDSGSDQTTGKSASSATVPVPVNFGDSSDLPAKIASLQTLMAQIDLTHVTEIDVSDFQHPYLRGNPQPATLSTTAGG